MQSPETTWKNNPPTRGRVWPRPAVLISTVARDIESRFEVRRPKNPGIPGGLILNLRFQHFPFSGRVPRRGRWWAAHTRCDLKPLSKDTKTSNDPGELMLTTALRPSSDCQLCTPSPVTQCPTFVLKDVLSSTRWKPLQPNLFRTNGSRHRSRFSRWLQWSSVLGLALTKWRLASTDGGRNEALGLYELECRRLQASTLSGFVEYLCSRPRSRCIQCQCLCGLKKSA